MTWQEIIKKYEERNNLVVTDVDYEARTFVVESTTTCTNLNTDHIVPEAAGRVAEQQAEDFYGKDLTPEQMRVGLRKTLEASWRPGGNPRK